jgi:hypothetical protein
MFLKAFLDRKVEDGIKYDTLNDLVNNAHCVLDIPERAIAAYLLEHTQYVRVLITKYTNW